MSAVAVQAAREEAFEGFGRRNGGVAPPPPVGDEAQVASQQQPAVVTVRTSCTAEAAEGTFSASAPSELVVADTPTEAVSSRDLGAGADVATRGPLINTVQRHSRLAPYKPGKMTVVLDMDECLLHSKFHGPGAASEAYRQSEERPDAVNEVNSFWVALDDGDTAQVNKRPGLDPFLEALARDYNTIVFTAAMPDYAGPVLDYIDPKGTLFHQRLYRSSCRQVKGAFLKDLSVLGLESTDMTRTVLVDNNPLSFICQPTNGVLVASFYDDPSDTALASVMQLIRHLDNAGDVRPILKDMFRLDTLLAEYRNALFDEDDEEEAALLEGGLEEGSGDETASAVTEDDLGAAGQSSEEEVEEGVSEKENVCLFEDANVECLGAGLKDDDEESVKTEACSEGSGESLGEESLASREEMELDLEF